MGKKKVKIDAERCKGCFLCVEICPMRVLKKSSDVNKKGWQYVTPLGQDKCTACGLCRTVCPDSAIEIG